MYAIRMYRDEPIWFCDGVEELFDSEEAAIQALNDEILEIEKDIKAGFLEDFDFDDYKIVKV